MYTLTEWFIWYLKKDVFENEMKIIYFLFCSFHLSIFLLAFHNIKLMYVRIQMKIYVIEDIQTITGSEITFSTLLWLSYSYLCHIMNASTSNDLIVKISWPEIYWCENIMRFAVDRVISLKKPFQSRNRLDSFNIQHPFNLSYLTLWIIVFGVFVYFFSLCAFFHSGSPTLLYVSALVTILVHT